MAKSGSEASEWKSGVIESGIAEEQSGRGRLGAENVSITECNGVSFTELLRWFYVIAFAGFYVLLVLSYGFCLRERK